MSTTTTTTSTSAPATGAPAASPASTSRPHRGEPRPFDFRNPTTLPREHVRTLQIVQETWSRGTATTLASALRAVTHVDIGRIEQLPYADFTSSLPNPTALTTLALAPLAGEALLDVPLPLAFAATELMLGGGGSAVQPERALTELESALLANVIDLLLPVLRSAFEPVVQLEPVATGRESNPVFAQIAAPTDLVVLITLGVTIEAVSGEITLCVPLGAIQPHLEELSEHARSSSLTADKLAGERARLHALLGESEVVAHATFRPLVASSSQITSLAVGDVLLLDHPVQVPLTLSVGPTPVHDVRIGRVNRHLAVRVDGPIEPDRRIRARRLTVSRDLADAPVPPARPA